jgi:butyrate kinase
MILRELKEAGQDVSTLCCIMGRGGLTKPIPSGVYEVNDKMKNDMLNSPFGEHASNLGGFIADDIAKGLKDVKAYIADPVVVDELDDLSLELLDIQISSVISILHALNQKATARRYAREHNVVYEELNLIVAHLGGGISVGAHRVKAESLM